MSSALDEFEVFAIYLNETIQETFNAQKKGHGLNI